MINGHELKPTNANLEYIHACYLLLWEGLYRTLSDSDIDDGYNEKKRKYCRDDLRYHTDKHKDKNEDEMYQDAIDKVDSAYNQFKAAGVFGITSRYYYNEHCYGSRIPRQIKINYKEETKKKTYRKKQSF